MISDHQKAKLKFQCRRGMLELDLILQKFLDKHLDTLTVQDGLFFEQLLREQDPDLYAFLMGYETPNSEELKEIVAFIQSCN
jgi:antitoxin CptB